MENFGNKNKIMFFFVELVGTAILTFALNMGSFTIPIPTVGDISLAIGGIWIIFIVTFWAWELGAAHFNFAITLGSFLFNYDKIGESLIPMVALLLTQFTGSLLGMLMTYVITHKFKTNDGNYKLFEPLAPTLCPGFNIVNATIPLPSCASNVK